MDQTHTQPDQIASDYVDHDNPEAQQDYDQSEDFGPDSAHYDDNYQGTQQDWGQSEEFGSSDSANYDDPGTQYEYDQSKDSAPDSTHYDDQGTQQDYDEQDYDEQDYDQQQDEDLAFEKQDSQLNPNGSSDSRPVEAYPDNSSDPYPVTGAPPDNPISGYHDSDNAIVQEEAPQSPLPSNSKTPAHDPSSKSGVSQSPFIPKSAAPTHDDFSSKHSVNYNDDRFRKGNPSAIRRCIDQARSEDVMSRKSFEKLKYLLIGVTFGHYSTKVPSDLVECYELVAAMFEKFAGLVMKRRTGRCFAHRCKIIKHLLIAAAAGIRSGWQSTTLWAYQYVLALAIGKLTLYGMETKDLIAAHFVALEAMFMQRALGPFHDRAGFLWGIRKRELPGLDQFWVLASTYDPGCGCFVCDSTHRNVAFPDKEALLVIPGKAGQKPNTTVAPFETWFDRDMNALEKLLDCVYRVINVKPSLNHLLHGWTHTEARLAMKAPRDFPCANHKCLFCSNYPYVVSYSKKEKTGQGIDMGTHIPLRQGHPQFVPGYSTPSEPTGQHSGSSHSHGRHQSTSTYSTHQPSAHSSRSQDTSHSSRHQSGRSYSTPRIARSRNYTDHDRDYSASQQGTQRSSSSKGGW